MLYRVVKHLLSPDVNNNDSSSESFRTVTETPQSGDPASPGALGEDSPSSQANKDKEPSLTDTVKDVLKQRSSEEVVSEDSDESRSKIEQDAEDNKESKEKVDGEEKEDSTDDTETEGEEEGSETEEETTEEEKSGDEEGKAKKDDKIIEGKPVPYERFAELNTQLKTIRQDFEQVKPMVENYRQIDQFCRQYQITPEQFKNMLETQALLNTNPEEALKRINPIVESLKTFSGDVLPTDLQKAVDDGDITLKYAKEVARSRAVLQFGEKKLQHEQRNFKQHQEQQVQNQLAEATNTWEKTKRETDPDYKPKAKATDPDGKWEAVKRQFLGMLHEVNEQGQPARPITTPQQMAALLEEAYQSVDKFISRFRGKGQPKKNLRSDSSSTNGHTTLKNKRIEDAGSLQEAVAIGLAQRR